MINQRISIHGCIDDSKESPRVNVIHVETNYSLLGYTGFHGRCIASSNDIRFDYTSDSCDAEEQSFYFYQEVSTFINSWW